MPQMMAMNGSSGNSNTASRVAIARPMPDISGLGDILGVGPTLYGPLSALSLMVGYLTRMAKTVTPGWRYRGAFESGLRYRRSMAGRNGTARDARSASVSDSGTTSTVASNWRARKPAACS
jgi:hypothetical protein